MRKSNHPVEAVEWTGKKLGDCVIRLRWDKSQERVSWIDFEVFELAGIALPNGLHGGWDDEATEETAMFNNDQDNLVHELDEAEAFASGFVKWDGCTQFEADIHCDSDDELVSMLDGIKRARELAEDRMLREHGLGRYRDG